MPKMWIKAYYRPKTPIFSSYYNIKYTRIEKILNGFTGISNGSGSE